MSEEKLQACILYYNALLGRIDELVHSLTQPGLDHATVLEIDRDIRFAVIRLQRTFSDIVKEKWSRLTNEKPLS